MKTTQVTLNTYQDVSLMATSYEPDTPPTATILYLHGGGLEFGQREDLPSAYIEKFIAADIQLFTFDYLLAPEVKIDVILPVLRDSIQTMLAKTAHASRMILMGRSAGSYLAYLLQRDGLKVEGFIDLYGYSGLDYPEFRMPTEFYDRFPKVLPMNAQALIQRQPLVAGDMKDRYPLYVSGRQFGTWLSQFLPSMREATTYSLTPTELSRLPRTLLLHSTADPDVPFAAAQVALNALPDAELIALDQSEHDFDREATTANLAIYDHIIDFIVTPDIDVQATA